MKIRTQFIISSIIFGIILVAISAAMVVTYRLVEQTNQQEEIARKLQLEAYELSYLSNDFLLFHESQQLSRWESKFDSFSTDLASLNPSTPDQKALVNNIRNNQERLREVFNEVRTTLEKTPQPQVNDFDTAFVRVSWSRMEVQNQGMIFGASRLAQMLREQADGLKQMRDLLIFVLIGVFGTFLLANYFIIQRRALKSIVDLQEGTKIIGSGNLDFAIRVKHNDEIGELSLAFNKMAVDLKGVTASKTELEREIGDRIKAEERSLQQKAIQEGINRILEAALICDTEEEMGRVILTVAEQLTGSKFGFIGTINAQGFLDAIAISDPGWDVCRMEPPTSHKKVPTGFIVHGIYGKVLQDGKSFLTNDPSSHPDSIGIPEGHPPLTSFLGIPLASGGTIIGMVGLGNRVGGYRDEDLEAGESLASAIVEAFERKRAEEEIRQLNENLTQRAAELEVANKELEAFSFSVSHDLRAPLRHIDGFSRILLQSYYDKLDDDGKEYLQFLREGSQQMEQLIEALLQLSRVTMAEMRRHPINLSELAGSILHSLHREQPERQVEFISATELMANGDLQLMRIALENLLGNAWKFTAKRPRAVIEFGITYQDGKLVYFVKDNGAGFDMAYSEKLFNPFQRLHGAEEFSGTGIGLATVNRIIQRHGGRVWAQGEVDKGATFYYTMGG